MWNFIRSRLTDMPHIILGIDFTQALNPLYALPIVAVIVCVFLVYAFGFKSPVQPPSFDEIETDKKPAKKRKGKENQKSKQNGKTGGASGRNADGIVSEKKKKADKQHGGEKPTPKPETKVVKRGNASERKKKLSVSQEHDHADDANEEGWVHHVSKKGRKNRKKDDSVHSDAVVLGGPSHSNAMELFTNLPEDTLEQKPVIENDHAIDIGVDAAAVNEDEPDVVLGTDASSNKQKKQKKKFKETGDKDMLNDVDVNSADILHQTNDAPLLTDPENGLGSNETIKVSREKKTKKKKKKQVANEKEADINAAIHTGNESNQNGVTSSMNNVMLSDNEKASVVKDLDKKTEKLTDSEAVGNIALEGSENVNNEAPIEAKGSNVAFDELEGLYPESKPMKRKKRVRRDH